MPAKRAATRSRSPEEVERYGLVAVLDALGTRRLWSSEGGTAQIRGRVRLRNFIRKRFVSFRAHYLGDHRGERGGNRRAMVTLNVQFLSDTIVLTVIPEPGMNSAVALDAVGDLLILLMVEALKNGVLLRGALSEGRVYLGKDFLVGPAVDEAAEWGRLGLWAGVQLTPTAEARIDAIHRTCPPPFGFRRWNVPMHGKGGVGSTRREGWVVAWPLYAEGLRGRLDRLFLQGPVPPDVSEKHRNTLAFFDYSWSGNMPLDHHFIAKGAHPSMLVAGRGLKKLMEDWHRQKTAPPLSAPAVPGRPTTSQGGARRARTPG